MNITGIMNRYAVVGLAGALAVLVCLGQAVLIPLGEGSAASASEAEDEGKGKQVDGKLGKPKFKHDRNFIVALEKEDGADFGKIVEIRASFQRASDALPMPEPIPWTLSIPLPDGEEVGPSIEVSFRARSTPQDGDTDDPVDPNDPQPKRQLPVSFVPPTTGIVTITIVEEDNTETTIPIEVEETFFDPCPPA